jgi:hypothetical protein
VLLRRCLYDNDDEVRDRATLYSAMLSGTSGVAPVAASTSGSSIVPVTGSAAAVAKGRALVHAPLATPMRQLDASLSAYLEAGDFSTPFGLDKLVAYNETRSYASSSSSSLSSSSSSSSSADDRKTDFGGSASSQGGLLAAANGPRAAVNPHLALLNSIPEFAALGPLFRCVLFRGVAQTWQKIVVSVPCCLACSESCARDCRPPN